MLSSFCAHCLVHENPEEQCDTHTPKNWIIIGDRLGGKGRQSGTQIMKSITVEETKRAFVDVPHGSAYASKQPVVPQCV